MANKRSTALEFLPGPMFEWLTGSTKSWTASIRKNGRNIISSKLKQPNKTGGDPNMFRTAGEKWRAMTETQKQLWKDIAKKELFRSGWNAFTSSFFKSVAIHGLDYTNNHEPRYITSDNRQKRARYLDNSLKRLRQYPVAPELYIETEAILRQYPVDFSTPEFFIHLRDLTDVNNALSLELLYRTDDIAEYQFTVTEKDQYGEKGGYTVIRRPRQRHELFEPIY